mmetsp:Transcript_106228/g.310539  ORF Transcript_106228/g.310539 Transcript_106228/m.310539 type:complete len:216 (-) Transcript_106228:87-734(-)
MVEKNYGTCLLCIPLRIGIVLIAMGTLAYGFVGAMVLATGDLRLQPGGYSIHTARLQAAMGTAGLIFGLMGLLGVYDGKPDWVRNMARFLEAKLVVALIVFVFDLVALMRCPTWASIPHSQVTNPPLYAISSKGLCSTARLCYGIGFAIDFGFSYYCAWVSHIYCRRLASSQSYLISFANSTDNHCQVKLTDSNHGSPVQYLGSLTSATPMAYGT